MQAFEMEIVNSAPILSALVETITQAGKSKDKYLLCEKQRRMTDPKFHETQKNSLGIKELTLPNFFKKLGIKSLMMCNGYDVSSLTKYEFIVLDENKCENFWNDIKNDQLIADLLLLFKKCSAITFNDWTDLVGTSGLLTGLFDDVIKPLNKSNLDFIFYLDDPGKTLFYQIDNIHQIVNKFGIKGKVTFVLDEFEAVNLWMVLNGEMPNTTFSINTPYGLKKKCFSILRTMSINRLLIYSVNSVILFSEEQQFIFARRDFDQIAEIAADARDKFITGFSFGLLSKLDIQHCIALGLIMLGVQTEMKIPAGTAELLMYVEKWLADHDQNNDKYLYQ
ncbi:hypothetical protein [Mucilaginibacter gossypii]|uniref:Uncharacterized protein n=1 Tax=Mucilaginibacter gossypii TaxID=551996 RepID=A0A1G8A9C3_9SPHI|nr:hypothetical protein [Mucilaginibacter gossypii]SDH17562.1 hypothetical protein SAMN05192573_107131 [Mucilaginibacter gossypii]